MSHDSQEANMVVVAEHLSVVELEELYEAAEDVTSSRHFQTIYLLAKGHSTREVTEITSFGLRWVEQLLERYNAFGPSALGDLRRGNGGKPSVLKPELLERLGVRLNEPPPDGGRWTSGKVARWMAQELALEKLSPQRGWEALKALGWSIQKPRPRNPKAASEAEQEAFKKKSLKPSPKRRKPIPASPSKPSRPTNTGSA
jgi:transposase